jgi:hypothetical protein
MSLCQIAQQHPPMARHLWIQAELGEGLSNWYIVEIERSKTGYRQKFIWFMRSKSQRFICEVCPHRIASYFLALVLQKGCISLADSALNLRRFDAGGFLFDDFLDFFTIALP